LDKARTVQRHAICAASEAGASLREIASEAGLSHEQVRRIIGDQGQVSPYLVTVERHGVAPLKRRMLVRARSGKMAGELAAWMAERSSGGMFEAVAVSRAGEHHWRRAEEVYDDADLWRLPGEGGQ
jgi:AraC-like DNA-binding protein